MNLSISSFRRELGVVALAALVLLGAEVGVRALEPQLSLDVQHVNKIPTIVADLAAQPGRHLLLLGNSMTREGVNVETLTSVWAQRGVPAAELAVARVYPDSTQLLDWHYLYRRYLAGETARPDLLVVGFSQLGLHDTPADADQIGRIARNATTLRDAPELFTHDLHTLSQRAEYLLADTSVGFAIRERIRLRVLDLLIPNFRPTQRALNEAQSEIAAVPVAADTAQLSYRALQRFLQLVDTQAVEVVFVAMPLRAPYALDPRLPALIDEAGAHLVDLRAVPGLTPAAFRDTLHLAPQGAEIYSRTLAHALLPFVVP